MLVAPRWGSADHENIARRPDCCVRSLTRASPKREASVRVKFTSLPNGLIGGRNRRASAPGTTGTARMSAIRLLFEQSALDCPVYEYRVLWLLVLRLRSAVLHRPPSEFRREPPSQGRQRDGGRHEQRHRGEAIEHERARGDPQRLSEVDRRRE